jgi:hypothetical protein
MVQDTLKLVKKASERHPERHGWVGIKKRRSEEMALRSDVKLGVRRSKSKQYGDPAPYDRLLRKLRSELPELKGSEKSHPPVQIQAPSLAKQAYDAFGEVPDLEEDAAIIFSAGTFVETRR